MIHANTHANKGTMTRIVSINGNSLPQLLVDLIDEGRWIVPTDESKFDNVFSEHAGVTFYSIEQMKSETEWWCSLATPDSVLLGRLDHKRPPGDIDPSKTILIGDAGIGFDTPLALDHRNRCSGPAVVVFDWNDKKWREVASSVREFAESVGL